MRRPNLISWSGCWTFFPLSDPCLLFQVPGGSKLTSLGLLFIFRLFITQASLLVAVFVPACSFFENFPTPRCLLFLVMINSKEQGTHAQCLHLRQQHVVARARVMKPVSQLQRDLTSTENNACSSLPWESQSFLSGLKAGHFSLSRSSGSELFFVLSEACHGPRGGQAAVYVWVSVSMCHLPRIYWAGAWLPIFAYTQVSQWSLYGYVMPRCLLSHLQGMVCSGTFLILRGVPTAPQVLRSYIALTSVHVNQSVQAVIQLTSL